MLSEHEAWVYLAKCFENPLDASHGICYQVRYLFFHYSISFETLTVMKGKLALHAPPDKSIYDYWWPLSPEGMEERVKFCKQRAEETKGV